MFSELVMIMVIVICIAHFLLAYSLNALHKQVILYEWDRTSAYTGVRSFLQGYTGDGFFFCLLEQIPALKILPRYFLTISYFITNSFELFVVCKRWTPNDSNLDGPKCPIQLLAFCTYFIGWSLTFFDLCPVSFYDVSKNWYKMLTLLKSK